MSGGGVLGIPMTMYLAIATPSLTNVREHWSVRAKRAHMQRAYVHGKWCELGKPEFQFPIEVRLVRVSPRKLDDDNLRGALKSVRDGVAACLGVDDADPRVSWEYDQRKGAPAEVAVEVVFCDLSTYRAEQHEDVIALARELVEAWPLVDLTGPPEAVATVSACVKSIGDALVAEEEFAS